jgi:hypothetical protein
VHFSGTPRTLPPAANEKDRPSRPEIRQKPIYVNFPGHGTRSVVENPRSIPGVLVVFASQRKAAQSRAISTTPGLSVGLSPASGVIRCILVTVEKKWRGNSNRLHELIAAQGMYRSNWVVS